MKRKVTFNKSGSGSINARLLIPMAYLEPLGINEDNREVEIKLEGNKLIITKAIKEDINE